MDGPRHGIPVPVRAGRPSLGDGLAGPDSTSRSEAAGPHQAVTDAPGCGERHAAGGGQRAVGPPGGGRSAGYLTPPWVAAGLRDAQCGLGDCRGTAGQVVQVLLDPQQVRMRPVW